MLIFMQEKGSKEAQSTGFEEVVDSIDSAFINDGARIERLR
jgi:hypothetical protein